jgi:hypothetical protein
MGLGINAIGNYGLYSNRIKATNGVAQTRKTQNVQGVQKTTSNNEVRTDNVISEKEKEFFVNLYPNDKETVMSYHFYQRNGEMSGVAVGSIINRRG